MNYVSKAREEIRIAEYLLRDKEHLESSVRRSVIARLNRAIDLMNHPMPLSPQVEVRQVKYQKSCGYPMPTKTSAWYYRVRTKLDKAHALPDCYFIIQGVITPEGADVVAISKNGPILGPCYVDGQKAIGVRCRNNRFDFAEIGD